MSGNARRIGREHALLQVLRREHARLVPLPDHVLVGYSGGGDSLALLALLKSLAGHAGFNVSAIHVNHGVRPGADDDAELAAGVCAILDIPLAVQRIDRRRLELHQGVGLEEALRRERYLAFATALKETEANVLALAHHQRDQAETVLLHLVRGAGLAGASGMRAFTGIAVPWWEEERDFPLLNLPVWRPLLGTSVEEVRATATATGLPIAEDPSNQDESLRRNAIRHAVLPLLEQVVTGATANIARFGRLAAMDDDELEGRAQQSLAVLASTDGLDRHGLLSLSGALPARVLRRWIEEHGPVGIEIARERVEAVLDVASTPGPRRMVELGRGASVEVTRNSLRLVIRAADQDGT